MANQTKKSLSKISKADLAAMLAVALGNEVDPDTVKDDLIDQLLAAQEEGHVLQIPAPVSPAGDAPEGDGSGETAGTDDPKEEESPAKPKAAKRYRVKIFSGEGPGGNDDVTVSVNGKTWQIKRDRTVEVPEEVVHVLENAVVTKYEQIGIDKETGEMKAREFNVRRFNFDKTEV